MTRLRLGRLFSRPIPGGFLSTDGCGWPPVLPTDTWRLSLDRWLRLGRLM